MAELAPLEREADSWTLPNGLRVSERRIPIGTVGANFEARPNVALDVAGQLLKSLNTAVLRTGGAALRTVTVLVDEVLRPALEAAGLPAGRGRARPLARSRGCARPRLAPAADPARDPARKRGDDGRARAARRRERRADARPRRRRRRALRPRLRLAGEGARTRRREPRPARRLQPAQPPPRRPRARARSCPALLEALAERGLEVRGDVDGALPLDRRLGYEWANDAERVSTVTVAARRRSRRGGADRQRGDLGPRRRDRRRGRGRGRRASSTATAAPLRTGTRRPGTRTASS